MFKSLYKKCLNLAGHRKSNFFLGLVSFAESSFFPIPPDVMIIPMVIAKRKNFFRIFLIASIFSVLGGIFGYILGSIFLDMAMNVIEFYEYENKINTLINSLAQGEGLIAWLGILFLAGFTPLPYKVFTIASGLIGFNLLIFIIVSLISRSLRFFIIAYLSYKFGDLFTEFMNRNGSKWFTVLGVLLVLIFIIVFLVIKFNA